MKHPMVRAVNVEKPGFLNITLDHASVGAAIIARALESGDGFGESKVGDGTKVVIEHTNINSNKAAHVGHLRNSCIGDTVARSLRSQGYIVEVENYIDDTGVQVADVVVGLTLLERGDLDVEGGPVQLPDESFDYYCSRVYVATGRAYEARPELLAMRRAVLRGIEAGSKATPAGEPDYATRAADLSARIVNAHLGTMSRLNIYYDLLTWESAIVNAGLWKRTFEMLRDSGVLIKPEFGPAKDCWVVPFGDNETDDDAQRTTDKILVKSDGTATYTGKDIAYQLWKFGLSDDSRIGVKFHFIPWSTQANGEALWTMRAAVSAKEARKEAKPGRFGHADRVINVIDTRQSYPQQVVYESLRRLGYTEQAEKSTHLAYEVVALSPAAAASLGVDVSDGRSTYAMSGRKGVEIKADDLINLAIERLMAPRAGEPDSGMSREAAAALAASAIRYFMVRFDLQQMIVLDIDQALRPNGDSGVYLQYAHARAHSILRRLAESGYTEPATLSDLPASLDPSEWDLLRQIDAWPRSLAEATVLLEPHRIAAYALDLATRFNDFYDHTPPVLRETNIPTKDFRATLVRAAAQTLRNALTILGFTPLNRL